MTYEDFVIGRGSPGLRGSFVLWNGSPVTYFGVVRTRRGAKRLECAELAPAFGAGWSNESASELDALHTLRVDAIPISLNVSVFRAAHISAFAFGRRAFSPRSSSLRHGSWYLATIIQLSCIHYATIRQLSGNYQATGLGVATCSCHARHLVRPIKGLSRV